MNGPRAVGILGALAASAVLSAELDRRREAGGLAEAGLDPGSAADLGAVGLGGLRPFVLDVLWCRATDQWMRKEWHETAATFEAIERLEPRVPEVWIANAWTLCVQIAGEALARGDEESAWAWFSRGLDRLEEGRRVNPRSARIVYYLSVLHSRMGRSEPFWSRFQARGRNPVLIARELARAAVDLSPENPSLHYWAALASRDAALFLVDRQRLAEAREMAREALRSLDETRRRLDRIPGAPDGVRAPFEERLDAWRADVEALEADLGRRR